MESPTNLGDQPPIFYVGQHESSRVFPVSDELLRQAQDCGYDMLTTPISTESFRKRVEGLVVDYLDKASAYQSPDANPFPLVPPLTPDDTNLVPSETISQLIGVTSPWIDLASPDPLIAHVSRHVLNQEIAYASFCGLSNIIVEGPRLHQNPTGGGVAQYARAIQEALGLGAYIQIHIVLHMVDKPSVEYPGYEAALTTFAREGVKGKTKGDHKSIDLFGTWDAWDRIRSVSKYNQRLSVALILPQNLPPIAVQSRWFSEPLRLLMIPSSAFVNNKSVRPVLYKSTQNLITRYMRLKNTPWILLTDVGAIPGINDPRAILSASTGILSPETAADAAFPTLGEAVQIKKAATENPDLTPHLSYLRYLARHQPPRSTIERFGTGFQDYLQSPLQPLTDNLESMTYEVFEKDPIKYEWYERAITQALRDWVAQNKKTSCDGKVVVAVTGAGRGPLVTRALRASAASGVPIDMWAVEKNPNAYVLLQKHNQDDPLWNRSVKVIKSDMRAWKGPTRPDGTVGYVDIIVSELLGSFADNELSPECLDGVQHVLQPDIGISIPKSYTAHLTPIATPKLYSDIFARSAIDPNAFEIPWVVMLQAIDYLSAVPTPLSAPTNGDRPIQSSLEHDIIPLPDIQQAWEFSHPLPPSVLAHSSLRRGGSAAGGAGGATGGDGANEHNTRFVTLTFKCQERGVCHGLGGYFETVLYEGNEGKVELSTNPLTMEGKSRDMISWFPIFFPIKSPLSVPASSTLEISMWRQTDDRKVWYEWLVDAYVDLPNGGKARTATSDLHSSKKTGCLM